MKERKNERKKERKKEGRKKERERKRDKIENVKANDLYLPNVNGQSSEKTNNF